MKSTIQHSALPDLLTSRQLCTRWGIVPKTLLQKEKQGVIKPIKISRKKLYRISDVLESERMQQGGSNNEK
mgnify:FL=1